MPELKVIPMYRYREWDKGIAAVFDEWIEDQPLEKRKQYLSEVKTLMELKQVGNDGAKAMWVQLHCLLNKQWHKKERIKHAKHS